MQTHRDGDFRRNWLDTLSKKADAMVKNKQSEITAGKDGEKPLAEWKHGKVTCRHMPDDEHGILRISIGGGETPFQTDYCVIRGKVGQCIDLLQRAIQALRRAP